MKKLLLLTFIFLPYGVSFGMLIDFEDRLAGSTANGVYNGEVEIRSYEQMEVNFEDGTALGPQWQVVGEEAGNIRGGQYVLDGAGTTPLVTDNALFLHAALNPAWLRPGHPSGYAYGHKFDEIRTEFGRVPGDAFFINVVEVNFLVPVSEFSFSFWGVPNGAGLFYSGFTGTGQAYSDSAGIATGGLGVHAVKHTISAPTGGTITGFNLKNRDRDTVPQSLVIDSLSYVKTSDTGSTAFLLGAGLLGLAAIRRRFGRI